MEKSNSKDIKKSEEIKTFSLSEDFIIRVNKSDVTALNNNSIKYGSFSETTTDDANTNEATTFEYSMGLSTSFTGEDNLDVAIDAGNTTGNTVEKLNTTGDTLTVDGITYTYTFPVGDNLTIVAGDTDGRTLFTTACAYGGPSITLDDCGNVNAGITGGETTVGASYDLGSGFSLASGITGNETDNMIEDSLILTDSEALSYIASHSDLIVAFGTNIEAAKSHYINNGYSEGRSSTTFNASNYLAKYGDLQSAFGSDTTAAVQHYVESGYPEGRTDTINEYPMNSGVSVTYGAV